jgi:hypothetical protein
VVFACQQQTPSSAPLGGVDEPPAPSVGAERTKVDTKPRKSARAPDEKESEEQTSASDEEEDEEKDDEKENAGGAPSDDEKDKDEKRKTSQNVTSPKLSRGELKATAQKLPATCDDSKPATINCRPLTERCPPLAPVCGMLESTFKPKVAQALVDCAADRECGAAQLECLRPALNQSCVDDKARVLCAEREKTCKREYKKAEVTRADCEHGLSALLPEVRARMAACMSETCDVRECIAKIIPSPLSEEDE